jgi:diaminohydroxyphosphoribosylaminopyrimidine deaminase/5-amino-6-(5-phosphoribosylamino)uracil reductase
VILKLAVSADRRIGRRDTPNLAITGPIARARTHVMRAEADVILIGIGTASIDDPDLTVRLPGMAVASPIRVVLDAAARLAPESRLARSARDVPVRLLVGERAPQDRRCALAALGVEIVPVPETPEGRIDLEAALVRLAADGIGTVVVEGGAEVAAGLLAADLVDDLALFESERLVGADGVAVPADLDRLLDPAAGGFVVIGREGVGPDRLTCYRRARPTRP